MEDFGSNILFFVIWFLFFILFPAEAEPEVDILRLCSELKKNASCNIVDVLGCDGLLEPTPVFLYFYNLFDLIKA